MEKKFGKRKVGRKSRWHRTIAGPLPIPPFNNEPIANIASTPQKLEFYIADDINEEKAKIWSLHVLLGIQYEDELGTQFCI